MTALAFDIHPLRPDDQPAIEKLHQRAFGPGRFARTAFRVREQSGDEAALGFVARVGSLLVGSVLLTPIRLGEHAGYMLGPLTVEPAFEGRGIGMALLRRCEQAAIAVGAAMILLVGDEAYYARAGYRRVPPGRIMLPGPVDGARVLVLPLGDTDLAVLAGTVTGKRAN